MVINEQHIRKIVEEALTNILNEALDMGTIGGNGPISEAELVDPKELFANECAMAYKIYLGRKKVDLDAVFGDTLAYKVYNNYKNAMMSKPGKQARGFLGWLSTLCLGKMNERIMGFKEGDNYLFGFWTHGFFISAYFAPVSPIGMYKIIKSISQYSNIIFPITQDMSGMLERLGIPKASQTHDANWRGQMVTKDVFGTSQEAIDFGMKALDKWNSN